MTKCTSLSGDPGQRTAWRAGGPGDGETTLLIHGLTTPSVIFDPLARELAAQDRRVVAYDLWGRGLSDRPPGAQNAGHFLDQIDALMRSADLTAPLHVAGYSMGGAIAAAFAARDPTHVRSLTLIAAAGIAALPGGWLWTLPLLGDLATVTIAGALLRREAARTEVPEIRRARIAETRTRGYLSSVLSSRRHLLSRTVEAEHRAIAAAGLPVVAVWGGRDSVIPETAQTRLAQLNPAARQIVLPDADHDLPWTHAREIACAMRL